jgi:uncharacterized phage-like protein YoqJ
MTKTVAITGHRPEKIDDPVWVKKHIRMALEDELFCDFLIQGMASGVDLWSGQIARQLGIRYECARPWSTHKPRKADKDLYEEVLHFADKVTNVTPQDYYPGPWVYPVRNKYMVSNADVVLAVWDGTHGGTFDAVGKARQIGKPIYRIDPLRKSWGWYGSSAV